MSIDHVGAAMRMLASERKEQARDERRTYLTLASIAMREQREGEALPSTDTRPIGAHKFKPLDRASGRMATLRHKKNRRERMLARGEVPPANPWG